jgi:predicted RNA-binding protein with TRAM domain
LSVAFTAGSDGGSAITDYKWSVDGTNYTTRSGTSSPIVITGLTNGTAYTVRIRAVNAIGDGTVATAGSSATPRTTPAAPTIGTITPGDGQLSVAFTAGSDGGSAITDYKWSVDGTNYTTRSGTSSPIVISGLTNGIAYTVRILAVNAAGDGAVATAGSTTTPRTTPTAPTITGITPGNNQLSVAFTAPSSNGGASITNYEYSINGGTDWVTPSPALTTSPLLITGLMNGTTYDIQLRAVNSAGSGVASSTVQGTPVVPPLPVSLLSFSGYKDGFRNQLRWLTASEVNNSGFEVQRSADGINYQSIGFVNSLAIGGNSQTQLKYNFTDANPNGLKQYYRLKQFDIDGRSTLSNILLIQGEKPVAFEIASVYPNPSRGQVTVLLNAPENKAVTIRLIDLAGRTLQTKQINALAGNNSIPFDISNMAKGQYLISVGEKLVKIVRE